MFNPYAIQTISFDFTDDRTGEVYPIKLSVKRLNAKQAIGITTKYSQVQSQISRAQESESGDNTSIVEAALELESLFRSQLAYTVTGIEGVDFGPWERWPESFEDRVEYLNELGSSFVQQAIIAYNKGGESSVPGKSSRPSRKPK